MNVLLADDEELARTRLRKLLAGYGDVIVVGEAGDGEEAIQQVAELRPDAVFLDIKMPGADGLEVVRSLGSRRPKIVFCTAFDEYAVEAFELHAVDYLLKPVTRARLAVCIDTCGGYPLRNGMCRRADRGQQRDGRDALPRPLRRQVSGHRPERGRVLQL